MKVGDKVEVRCYEVDSMGRVNLTMLKEGEAPLRAERPPMGGGGDRGGQRGGGRPNFRSFRDSR
jgi:predicted RNA-binding protein with RPS1 domain